MNADESLQSGHLAEINNEKVIDENDKTDEQGSKACAGVAAFSSALRSGAAWKRKIFVSHLLKYILGFGIYKLPIRLNGR